MSVGSLGITALYLSDKKESNPCLSGSKDANVSVPLNYSAEYIDNLKFKILIIQTTIFE